jgi:hypothetical protein
MYIFAKESRGKEGYRMMKHRSEMREREEGWTMPR